MKPASLLLGAALLFLAACRSETRPQETGPVAAQDRPLPDAGATGLDISAPLNVHVRIGAEPACRLEGPAAVLGRLQTDMQGSTFRISTRSKESWSSSESIEAWITIPHLRSLHTTGAGKIVVDSRIEEPSLELDLGGAVTLDLAAVQAGQLRMNLGGAGNVLIRDGEVGAGTYTVSGTGNIDAFGLTTRNASVSVSGAGRAALSVSGQLDATITGTGMIRYKGNPAIEKHISGIGTLQAAN